MSLAGLSSTLEGERAPASLPAQTAGGVHTSTSVIPDGSGSSEARQLPEVLQPAVVQSRFEQTSGGSCCSSTLSLGELDNFVPGL